MEPKKLVLCGGFLVLTASFLLSATEYLLRTRIQAGWVSSL